MLDGIDDIDYNHPLYHFVSKQLSGLTDTLEGLTLKDCEDQLYNQVIDHPDYSSYTKLCHLGILRFLLTSECVAPMQYS